MSSLKTQSFAVLCAIFASSFCISSALAANSVPRTIDYQGVILDANNNPVVTPLTFRFSFWSDSDYNGNSILPSGEINSELANFSKYSEVQEVTPDRNGNFRTAIGSVSPLPKLNPSIHKYLQVEVKTPNAALSSFELLDVDSDSNNTNDRKLLSSSPFAITSEAVEYSDLGYEAGKIPTLDENGKLLKKAIPNGTESNTFILNANDQDEDVRLQFGYTLNKVIKWAKDLARFEIGDSLHIWGNLTTSGTINGRDLTADGAKLDNIGNLFSDEKDATEISFSSTLFRANNVADALTGLKNLIEELTSRIALTENNITNMSAALTGLNNSTTSLSEQITTNTLKADENAANIETLSSSLTEMQQKSALRTVYNFDFLSGTDNKGLKSGQEKNRGMIIFHSGSLTNIGATSNPTDSTAIGTIYITKNDSGTFDQSKVIASISLTNTGTGDSNNSKFEAVNNVALNTGDVLRAYHAGKDDETSTVFIEVQSNIQVETTATTETNESEDIVETINNFNDAGFYSYLVKNNSLKDLRKNKQNIRAFLEQKYKEYLEYKKKQQQEHQNWGTWGNWYW